MDTNQNITPASEEQIAEQNAMEVNAEATEQMDFSDEEALLASSAEEFSLGDDELEHEPVDGATTGYSGMAVEELLAAFRGMLQDKPVEAIRRDVELIKTAFYKQYKQQLEKHRKSYLDAGGDPEAYVAPDNASEKELKDLFGLYRDKRNTYMQQQDAEKEKNYKLKLQLIDELKELIDKKEDINRTFNEFRDLQRKWKEVGPIPQANIRDTWDTYNHHVEIFYDYIKINRELRDLDLKKNLEIKTLLCEKVEALDQEELIVPAFRKLQKFHEQWREIGPVPAEFKDSLWERFKEATAKINKKHQEYFDSQKDVQQKNHDAKVVLCEKVEAIVALPTTNSKEWSNHSKEVVELQTEWKTLGQASRKDNGKLYERFRNACDAFFANKRTVFNNIKRELEDNLQKKIALCMRAEELSESSEWKKTTDELIDLQKQWKGVGVVPRKVSDEVWKRFRKACDMFFERKNKNFSAQDAVYAENLRLKEALIAEIKEFQVGEDIQADVVSLKEFQQRWNEIGYVPIKEKERVQQEYRKAIDSRFKSLKLGDSERKINRFKTKIESQQNDKGGSRGLRSEREKLLNQIRQIEGDVTLWENNIGFFAKSKNADVLIADVRKKIERAKEEVALLEEKIRLIDKQFE